MREETGRWGVGGVMVEAGREAGRVVVAATVRGVRGTVVKGWVGLGWVEMAKAGAGWEDCDGLTCFVRSFSYQGMGLEGCSEGLMCCVGSQET